MSFQPNLGALAAKEQPLHRVVSMIGNGEQYYQSLSMAFPTPPDAGYFLGRGEVPLGLSSDINGKLFTMWY